MCANFMESCHCETFWSLMAWIKADQHSSRRRRASDQGGFGSPYKQLMLCLFISYGRSYLMFLGAKPPEAIKPSMLYRNIKPLVVEAVQVKEAVDVPTNGGVLHAKRGDWL